MAPLRSPIINGTIVTVYSDLLYFVSKASCRYHISLSLHFVSISCCVAHAIPQIQICFLSFVSSINSGLLVVSVFRRLNWKSQTSFALSFSKTIHRSHLPLYHTVSAPVNLCSFSEVTAIIISALLCLAKYSLLNKTVHPATTCSNVSLCRWHTRHLPCSISLWAAFQDFVPTIGSSIDMIDDAFRGWRFSVSQRWHYSSSSLKNLLCCSLDWHISILICLVPFWAAVFILFHVGEFCEISKNTFFTEDLWTTASFA